MRAHISKANKYNAAEIFLLITLLSDDYFRLLRQGHNDEESFFSIVCKLPYEMQCMVCNMTQGVKKVLVASELFNHLLEIFVKEKLL
jgi:hypothetical protein